MDTNSMMSLAALVRARNAGKANPELMVALCRDAIARKDRRIRAFAHVSEAAPAQAAGPLAGIAIGVKDILDTFDQPTAYGSTVYEGHQPRVDAAIVDLAPQEGRTIIGKTATTEFAFFSPAATVNPHNHAHTPGGSSSGSAAAVAAGMIPAAIGTQTGGSVVRPAAFCGIAGYKPSYRLLPATGMKHFAPSLDTVGLFAASVGDVALLAELLTGRDLSAAPVEPARSGTVRVLYRCGELATADPGHARRSEQPPRTGPPMPASMSARSPSPRRWRAPARPTAIIQNHEAGLSCGSDLARFRDRLSGILTSTIEDGQAITPSQYDDARRLAKRGRGATRGLFGEVDILLTPSAPGAAPRGLETTGDPRFNKLWTLMGSPTINIPGFRDQAGMPLGIQAVARFGQDKTLLCVAAMLEKAFRT
jgi:Asp-tRNA(Asn)/Glu-tRNA(Gln) amidotransferase A subunit family amidase